MLFNGKFALCHFPISLNENLGIENLQERDLQTDGRMNGRKEIHPCVLQDIGPLGPLPKKYKKYNKKEKYKKPALNVEWDINGIFPRFWDAWRPEAVEEEEEEEEEEGEKEMRRRRGISRKMEAGGFFFKNQFEKE